MVRMSDILKKAKERQARKETQETTPPGLLKPEPVKEEVSPEIKAYEEKKVEPVGEKEEETEASNVRISPVVGKETRMTSAEETVKLYKNAVSLIREILKDYKSVDTKIIYAQIESIVNQLNLGNDYLLMLTQIEDFTGEQYLFYHSVNVCIYSIEIGLALRYEKPKLIELGISAFLHDIGMAEYLRVAHQSKKLIPKEYEEIKNHSAKGSQILKNIDTLLNTEVNTKIAIQHHERMDGSGYPQGLKAEDIDKYSKIIGIVDVYEAMTHVRMYRDRHSAMDTIKEVVSSKNKFDNSLIKLLIERIGIFPLGSFVELNTREIGQVIKLNRTTPLRPVIKIVYDADGEELKKARIFDLATQPTIFIKKSRKK